MKLAKTEMNTVGILVSLHNFNKYEHENNVTNEFQGKFRVSPFDINLAQYALQCDVYYSRNSKKNIVLTCCDQFDDYIPYTLNDIF